MRAGQHRDDAGIDIEQNRVRIVTRQEREQELVEVITREQSLARGHDMAALPLRAFESADFSVPAECQMQALQWEQHRPETGARPFGAFGYQGDAPLVAELAPGELFP